MSKERLRFSTDLLRRLGEELNQGADQGILELVRNAYDADATTCTVTLEGVGKVGGSIVIEDDGDGMDAEAIRQGWLVVGRSSKHILNKTRRKKRRPIGNKGIGRLAALRLGERALLSTRPRKDHMCEFKLRIDWTRFEAAEVVEEVPLVIEEVRTTRQRPAGTTIRIEGLREPISYAVARKLARAMVLLADPFSGPAGGAGAGFRPILRAEGCDDLENLVDGRYFDQAEFRLHAELGKDGLARAVAYDRSGRPIYEDHNRNLGKEGSYDCPAAVFDLWIFLLSGSSFTPAALNLKAVKDWLRDAGGIHLYHHGMRVLPYSDLDWVGINLKRSSHPDLRPSTNTCIGRISVEDPEGLLKPKTDRLGFVEEGPFAELKRFALDSVLWLSSHRERDRDAETRKAKESADRKVARAKRALAEAVDAVEGPAHKAVERAVRDYERAKEDEANTLRDELQLYRTLCTAGATAATFAHQAKGTLGGMKSLAGTLLECLSEPSLLDRETFSVAARDIKVQADSLLSLARATLDLLLHEKRRKGAVSVHSSIGDVVQILGPYLRQREIEVVRELRAKNDRVLASRAAIESIVANLLLNSLQAFSRDDPGERKVFFTSATAGETIRLTVSDTGPGIRDIGLDEIWIPGKTTTPEGTGLGLAIVRDVVHELRGAVRVVARGPHGGAEFQIDLPLKR